MIEAFLLVSCEDINLLEPKYHFCLSRAEPSVMHMVIYTVCVALCSFDYLSFLFRPESGVSLYIWLTVGGITSVKKKENRSNYKHTRTLRSPHSTRVLFTFHHGKFPRFSRHLKCHLCVFSYLQHNNNDRGHMRWKCIKIGSGGKVPAFISTWLFDMEKKRGGGR